MATKMKPERLALYAARFPKGFASILAIQTYGPQSVIDRKRGKHLPAVAKKPIIGGHVCAKLRIDPNGSPYEKGDILLSQSIRDELADWLIVGIGAKFGVNEGDLGVSYYQYAVVRRATDTESAPCRAEDDAKTKSVMDAMMSS